jgi:serine/threonine protein kinase
MGCNMKADIFSVGSILFNILTLKNLFAGHDYKEIMIRNKECDLENLDYRLKNVPIDAKDLVVQLLSKDFRRRPSAKMALRHKWFKKDL